MLSFSLVHWVLALDSLEFSFQVKIIVSHSEIIKNFEFLVGLHTHHTMTFIKHMLLASVSSTELLGTKEA